MRVSAGLTGFSGKIMRNARAREHISAFYKPPPNVCRKLRPKLLIYGRIRAETSLVYKKIKKNWRNALLFRFIALTLHSQNGKTRFCPLIGALVQLVRIHACHAWGHGFESRTHRNFFQSNIRKFRNRLISELFYFVSEIASRRPPSPNSLPFCLTIIERRLHYLRESILLSRRYFC